MSTARTGTADLPLHGGRVPAWLATRMASLGRVMVEAMVHSYGRDEVLLRLAHPFWFQCFGAVMGMDWHSSGITTSVLGALKRGLAPVSHELGLHVCGGRGRHSRRTPAELLALGESRGLDAESLVRTSRLVAKVDGAAVQDGYALYLHGFFVTDDGQWTVVQQGMNETRRQARRYHWTKARAGSFVDEPHAAIEGRPGGAIVNLTDKRAAASRALTQELGLAGPSSVDVLRTLVTHGTLFAPAVTETSPGRPSLTSLAEPAPPHLVLPAHHDVRPEDIDLKRLGRTLQVVASRGPRDFAELLLVPGVGARTLFALALVAEVMHGAPSRFADPARFSLAHGGKDGHPFPVPLRVYDETLRVLKDAVTRARLGQSDRLAALARLDAETRAVDAGAVDASAGEPPAVTADELADWVAAERSAGPILGARTVHDDRRNNANVQKLPGRQLSLPGLRR